MLVSVISWTPHINSLCSKAKRLIGLIYRNFYQHSSPRTLLTLYTAFVLPRLSYCSSIWDPSPSSVNSRFLEKVQHFALKMSTFVGLPASLSEDPDLGSESACGESKEMVEPSKTQDNASTGQCDWRNTVDHYSSIFCMSVMMFC